LSSCHLLIIKWIEFKKKVTFFWNKFLAFLSVKCLQVFCFGFFLFIFLHLNFFFSTSIFLYFNGQLIWIKIVISIRISHSFYFLSRLFGELFPIIIITYMWYDFLMLLLFKQLFLLFLLFFSFLITLSFQFLCLSFKFSIFIV